MKRLYVHPSGNRVIIEQDKLEKTTESGIVLQRDNGAAVQAGIIRGTVLAVGEDAWDKWSEPWAQVGDRVYFAKFAGKTIPDPVNEEVYLIMNDIDIIATIEEKEDD